MLCYFSKHANNYQVYRHMVFSVSRDIPFAGASITPCDKVNAGAIRDSPDSPDSYRGDC